MEKNTTELHAQISHTIHSNAEMLHALLISKLRFIERLKTAILNLYLVTIYVNHDVVSKLVKLLKQHDYIDAQSTYLNNTSGDAFAIPSTKLSTFVRENFLEPATLHTYRTQSSFVVLDSVARCVFNMERAQFLPEFLRHVFRGVPAPSIESHREYAKLRRAIDLHDLVFDIVASDFWTPAVQHMCESLYPRYNIELVELSKMSGSATFHHGGSVHSLYSQLRLSDVELMSLLRPNFDD